MPAFPSHHIEAAFSIVPGPCEVADALAHAERKSDFLCSKYREPFENKSKLKNQWKGDVPFHWFFFS